LAILCAGHRKWIEVRSRFERALSFFGLRRLKNSRLTRAKTKGARRRNFSANFLKSKKNRSSMSCALPAVRHHFELDEPAKPLIRTEKYEHCDRRTTHPK
jgi:hypothetical protein